MLATATGALKLPGRRLRQRLRAATLDPTPENTWDATDETYDPRDSAINLALLDEPLELPETPSRPKILAFAAPVAVLNLANFIMGSVDTAAVGTFGTTTQLAALAPGTMGMEYSCYASVVPDDGVAQFTEHDQTRTGKSATCGILPWPVASRLRFS